MNAVLLVMAAPFAFRRMRPMGDNHVSNVTFVMPQV